MTLVRQCFCGSASSEASVVNDLPVLVCGQCGAMRQDVTLTLSEYAHWYEDNYHDGVYQHTYEHDLFVAGLRLDSYEIPKGSKLLDIGCGNNAFVFECRSRGIDAWGQDLAKQAEAPNTFAGDLHDVAFPAESFDYVTMHDVLEHVPDPVSFLKEIVRVLKPEGRLFLDFPLFHHPAGRHHWKTVEHIWLLDEHHLMKMVDSCGFDIARTWHPIESKVVVSAKARPKRRISVLLPPGIGDSYWTLTKVPGLLKREGADIADVYIQDMNPRRTDPYIRNVSFASFKDYREIPPYHALLNEAYRSDARTIFPGEFGVDFFMSYNGVLTYGGRKLEDVDAELGTEWRPRTHMSKEALEIRKQATADGPYVVAYFIEHGMYRRWLAQFPEVRIVQTLKLLKNRGYRVLVVGAMWDSATISSRLGRRFTDLVGQTSFDQLYGLISGASAVVGFPSGATLIGPALNVPTVLIWNRFFNQNFWVNCVPPDAPYEALDSARLKPEAVLRAVDRQLERRRAAA